MKWAASSFLTVIQSAALPAVLTHLGFGHGTEQCFLRTEFYKSLSMMARFTVIKRRLIKRGALTERSDWKRLRKFLNTALHCLLPPTFSIESVMILSWYWLNHGTIYRVPEPSYMEAIIWTDSALCVSWTISKERNEIPNLKKWKSITLWRGGIYHKDSCKQTGGCKCTLKRFGTTLQKSVLPYEKRITSCRVSKVFFRVQPLGQ